jgi:hypothetical protein
MNTAAIEILSKLCKMLEFAAKHPDYHNMSLAAAQTLKAAAKTHNVDLFNALQIVMQRCVDENKRDVMHWYAAAFIDIEEGIIK